jgi:N-acyl-D-amino-acid deacylase
VKAHDGLFCWHLRDEDEALERSIEEVLAVARQTGVSTQISHLKVSGRGNWGGMAAVLDRIELAVADGLDVTFDSYPYDFGNTCLMTLLPADIVGGDVQEIVEKLQDGHWRERVAGVMNGPRSLVSSIGSENIVISGCVEAKNRELVGKSLRDAAASRGRAITDLIFDLTVEERGRTLIFLSQMCEADVRLALSHRLGCVVTDGIPAPKETAHPRLRSAFLQMLKKYVAEEGVCSLPEAVGKMAALPATKLRLKRRGTLAVGNFADINVFDMDRLKAGSVERRGMEYVVLNGQVVVENGEFSGTLAGKVLRSAHGDD